MSTYSRFFLAATLAGALLFQGGCAPKPVSPYAGGGTGTADSTSGNRMGNITEEMGPGTDGSNGGVEGLDSTGRGGSGSLGSDADSKSDAYKREHGRCSPEFKPIYFDYDQSKIKGEQIPIMEQNGTYLRNNPSARVLIEGNTDYRGTNEYNIALGERRAEAAKRYLREFGIEESRMRTVSYGEERPLFTGSSEDDYAHNRRDDFILE
ncbi:MAG: peptidoglycan-associated lipoprotein Pal [Desulfobulbus sp.]|jgi:peptidoglycan-associated lipoprotein|uniref:peptidoglycan-associated lipoprotein Pal n=1 Tax=Desulfobulbus sp. TaxID=895 RepID=UPI00283D7C61|nr:peptidoglycan-associated lipoprotein Pal [Desulfobulbus sp.]MDR2551257.1 peptidoglycan-associated lipoprotein Pal [Desulfobulbus sp.]